MKKFNNTGGFTLIEIIVVLIIVGILAAIALPNLFGNIQKSKSAQALSLLDAYKVPIEACIQSKAVAAGTAPCTLAGQGLTTTAQNGWTITIPAALVAQSASVGSAVAPSYTNSTTYTYTLVATDATNNTITITSANGIWSCSTGTASPYTGVC